MVNRPKAKGTAAESQVVTWLHRHGHTTARRLPPAGAIDVGDIDVPSLGIHLEIKNHQRLDLAAWLSEADAETARAGKPVYLVAKRRGTTNPGAWYAVMTATQLLHLLESPAAAQEIRNAKTT